MMVRQLSFFLSFMMVASLSQRGFAEGADSQNLEEMQIPDHLSQHHEIRGGVLHHNIDGRLKNRREKSPDLNAEFLFCSPENAFFEAIFSPRPHIGLSVNVLGYTSHLYTGVTWTVQFYDSFFVDFSFGADAHNGNVSPKDQGRRKALGSRVLFRESLSLGMRVNPQWTVSIMFDHVSNARLGLTNPGMNSLGVRVGYVL